MKKSQTKGCGECSNKLPKRTVRSVGGKGKLTKNPGKGYGG